MSGWSMLLLFIAVGLLAWFSGRRSRGRTPLVVLRLLGVVFLIGGLCLLGVAGWFILRHGIDWPRGYLRIIAAAMLVGSGILVLKGPSKGSVVRSQGTGS